MSILPPKDAIPVVAAVVMRAERVLLCQRHGGNHLPLMWEFPGGKIEHGESPSAALRRELREELDVDSTIGPQLATVVHPYPDKTVWIRFFSATLRGSLRPLVHRALAWVPLQELPHYPVPPPNARIVEGLLNGELSFH